MATGRPPINSKRLAVLAVTRGGRELGGKLAGQLAGAELLDDAAPVAERLAAAWPRCDGFVCVMAAGIVVRAIAPLLSDKRHDPAVVVVDEQGRFAVSLLSGHLGGANDLARQVAALTGGQPVITTASDVLGHTALDLWARDRKLQVEDAARLTTASARLVNQGSLHLYSEVELGELPPDLIPVAEPAAADIIVSCRTGFSADRLLLRPRLLVAGIGCNRGTSAADIETALTEAFAAHNLAPAALRNLASIDLKQDELGLLEFAGSRGLTIDFYDKDQLNAVAGVSVSAAVQKATGAVGVAEPAALISAGQDKLLVRKMKWKDVTVAIAQARYTS